MIYDIVIVGYGPAGITAALYAARKKLSILLIGQAPGGEIANSGEIENWPGDGPTDGLKLTAKFVQHLQLHTDQVTVRQTLVKKIRRAPDNTFTVETDEGSVQGKTIIYAAGRHPRLLKVPGEAEFKNRGVTYCATCDAPLFADKEVAVIGGGNTGAEAVIMLQQIASKIYLLHIEDTLKADAVLVNHFDHDPKVQIIYRAVTTKIEGSMFVEKLHYKDLKSNDEKIIPVQGVFVAIGAIPNTEPVKELVELDAGGAIKADRYGATNIPGFFAAGDVTDIRDAQIVVAASHGCSASLSAGDYLSRQPK